MNEKQKNEARTSNDPKVLDTLAVQYGRGVQKEVAKNPNTWAKTLDWIAKNQSWLAVIKLVINHKNTSVATLEWLIKECYGDFSLSTEILALCTAALSRQTLAKPQASKACKSCGKILEAGSMFCNACGTKQ